MAKNRVYAIKFSSVYPHYIQKAERKNRTQEEVDTALCWLTGYTRAGLRQQIKKENDLEAFFDQAPALNPNTAQITGVVCGVRIEEIQDPLMRKIRYMDKLIDELAKGRPMEKILRGELPRGTERERRTRGTEGTVHGGTEKERRTRRGAARS